jgi:hypothetical protein
MTSSYGYPTVPIVEASKMTLVELDFRDSNLVDDLLANCNALRTRAQKAEDQNKILKEKLVGEVAARFAYESNMQLCECRESAVRRARRQLRIEMPEVEW